MKRFTTLCNHLFFAVCSVFCSLSLTAQTFTFANYNTSPGAGSTANYTETSSGVTMTVTTSVSGTAGWTSLCGGSNPRYTSLCYGGAGLLWGVNWANLSSTVTATINFSTPISCASFNLYDINRNGYNSSCINLFTDIVDVSGDNSGVSVSPVITQSTSGDQNVSGTTTKSITGTEGSLGGAVTVSFSSNVNRIIITYKSASSITASLNTSCDAAGEATNPRDQYIIIGSISGSSANYGTLNGGNVTSCLSIDPSPIVFTSLPSGTPSYQWYSKAGVNSCPTGTSTTGWTIIPGATSSSFDPSAVTASTTYACFVTVSGCGSSTWASGCKTITVDNTNATNSPAMSSGDYLWQGVPSSVVSDIFVDDSSAVFTGTGWSASANSPAYGNGSKIAIYSGTASATRTATFYPNIITPGRYEIYEKHIYSSNRSANTSVQIKHGTGITSVNIDQKTVNTTLTLSTWVSLGTYYFNSGNDGYIYFNNAGENTSTYLSIDAIRLVFRGTNVYETASNWLEYNGTNFTVATVAPTTADHVFIKQTGACVNGYPTVTTTGAQSNDITIGTGAQLTSNNATNLTVAGSWSNSGTYIENQGKISFTGNSKTLTCFGGETFYDLSSASTSVLTLNNDATVSNGLWINGIISTGANRVNLNTTATDGISTGVIDGNYSGHINGNFRRTIVSNTATYRFPVGVGTTLTTNRRLLEWVNNNITGVTYLDGSVSNTFKGSGQNTDANISSSLAVQNGQVVSVIHPEAQWRLTPNTNPTGGNFGVRLYVQNFATLSASYDNKFVVLKRPDNSTTFADYNTFQSTTTIPSQNLAGRVFNSGSGYAQRLGYTSFSEFVIGSVPTPLGVDLKSVQMECDRDNYLLTFATASEVNASHYQLMSSNDGYQFDLIKEFSAAGTTYEQSDYSIELENNEYQYIRLLQYDFDGELNELFTLHVPDCDGEEDVLLMNTGEYIKLILPYNVVSDFSLFSSEGKLVLKGRSIGIPGEVAQLDIGKLNTGAYIIHLENSFETKVLKFVKYN